MRYLAVTDVVAGRKARGLPSATGWKALPCFACAIVILTFGASHLAADEPATGEAPRPALPVDLSVLLKGAEAWQHATPEARQQAVVLFRQYLPQVRDAVREPLHAHIQDKRAEAWEPIEDLIGWIACAGPFLLLLPLFHVRRYPGQIVTLFGYSALAAVLFSGTVLLFLIPLELLQSMWGELAVGVDPRLRMLDATFDLMDKNAEDFLSRDLPLQPALQQAADGSAASFVTLLLDNLAEVEQHAEAFAPVARLYRRIDYVFGSLPKIQCFIFAVLFVVPLYPIFKAIVQLPQRAAEGGRLEGWRVAKLTVRNWWREIVALLTLQLIFLVIAVINDVVLSTVAEPATEAMLNFLFAALDYLGTEAAPSFVLLYFSLAAVALFYLFNIVVMTAAIVLYLRAALRILRLRFHEKVPLRSHAAFWKWGSLALLWVQLLPVAFIYLAWPGIQQVFGWFVDADTPDYLGGMVIGGSLLLFGILLVFWLARGFRALLFLARYRAPTAQLAVH